MPRKNNKKNILRSIAKTNPGVDIAVLERSAELLSFMRSIGIKNKGFNTLSSYESSLKLKPPTLHKLHQSN